MARYVCKTKCYVRDRVWNEGDPIVLTGDESYAKHFMLKEHYDRREELAEEERLSEGDPKTLKAVADKQVKLEKEFEGRDVEEEAAPVVEEEAAPVVEEEVAPVVEKEVEPGAEKYLK